jgi:DNA-binding transcriptional ArsR family regulator
MSNRSDVQISRDDLLDHELVASLADTFKVLGDPTRIRILDALSRAELCVSDIADLLDLTESAVSHQLRVLRTTRLVRQRRAGQLIFYTLDDQHIVRLFAQGLEHVQERGEEEAVRTRSAPYPAPAAKPLSPPVARDNEE